MKGDQQKLKLTALTRALGAAIEKGAVDHGLGPHEIAFVLSTVLGEVINNSTVTMDEVAHQIARIIAQGEDL